MGFVALQYVAMAFDDLELKRIDRQVGALARQRSPEHVKDQIRTEYRVKGHDVVLYSTRPDWLGSDEWMEEPIAKFKFVRSANEWRLFWMRRDLKWHRYEGLPASDSLANLVQEVDSDPWCCFFG